MQIWRPFATKSRKELLFTRNCHVARSYDLKIICYRFGDIKNEIESTNKFDMKNEGKRIE
jgi:hypothetical protein